MTYTLSKIFAASIGGSVGLLARGASQKKCSSSAHIGPPVFLAFSISAFTLSESGLAGAPAGGCAIASIASMTPTIILLTIRESSGVKYDEHRARMSRLLVYWPFRGQNMKIAACLLLGSLCALAQDGA